MKRKRSEAVVVLAAVMWISSASAREVLTPEEIVERELDEKRKAKPVLSVEPSELRVSVREDERKTVRLTVRNAGGGKLRWSVPSSPRWVALDVRGGELGYEETRDLFLTVDAAGTKDVLLRETIVFEAPAAGGSPTIIPIEVAVPDRAGKKPEPPPVPPVAAKPPPGARVDAPRPPVGPPASAVVAPPAAAATAGFRYLIEAGYVREMTKDLGGSGVDWDRDGPEISATVYFRRVPGEKYPLDAAAFAHRVSWVQFRVLELGSVDSEIMGVAFDEKRGEIESVLRYAPRKLPFEMHLRYQQDAYDLSVGPTFWQKSDTHTISASFGYFVAGAVSLGGSFGVETYRSEDNSGTEYTASGTTAGVTVRGVLPLGAGKAVGFEGLYLTFEDNESDYSSDTMQAALTFYPSRRTRLGFSARTQKPEGGEQTTIYAAALVAHSEYGAGIGLSYGFLETEFVNISTVKAWFVLRK